MSNKKVFFDPDVLYAGAGTLSSSKRNALHGEFRAIKREVLRTAFDGNEGQPNKNRIMITSLGEQHGKTFTAVNLALSIALEQNKYVMLVDVNVLSPCLGDMATPLPDYGLIDYLREITASVEDIIYATNIDRLRLVPIGHQHVLANELFNGEHMIDLMAEFQQRYNDRVVIFDAPPLLGVNEAMTLSAHVDQIIVVIEDAVVWEREIRELQACLPPKTIVHYVLNKAPDARTWKQREGGVTERAAENAAEQDSSGLHGSSQFL